MNGIVNVTVKELTIFQQFVRIKMSENKFFEKIAFLVPNESLISKGPFIRKKFPKHLHPQ